MLKRIGAIANAWGHYECTSLAAGVAYYGALSLFPLMIILLSGVGFFFRFMSGGPSAKEEIIGLISTQISPEFGESMSRLIGQIQTGSPTTGPLAFVAFFFAATLIFAQLDRAFYRIWDVKRLKKHRGFWPSIKLLLKSRLRSIGMILGIGIVIVVMFVSGFAIRALASAGSERFPVMPEVLKYSSLIISSVVNVILLTLIYRFLSKEKVTWLLALVGGMIAAGLWELGSRVLQLLSFGDNLSVYGLIGSFLVVLLWIYYNVMVLLFGALIVRMEVKFARQRG